MFLTQDQQKMTDLHSSWKWENCKDAARFRFDPVIKAKKPALFFHLTGSRRSGVGSASAELCRTDLFEGTV